MMIGHTRVAVGPVRDLGQLDATIGRIGTIPGVGRVAVDAFVDRRVLLAVHLLHPIDLAGELRIALRGHLASCAVGSERVEVELRHGRGVPGEVVDGTVEDAVDAGRPVAPAGPTASDAPVSATPCDAVGGSPWAAAVPRRARPATPAFAGGGAVCPAAPGPSAGPVASALLAPARRSGPPAAAPRRGPEELLELSFAHAPVAKALVSPDGRWLRVNRRLCALLGRDERAVLHSRLQDLTHPDDVGSDAAPLRALLAGEIDRYAAPKRYLHAAARVIPARLEVAAVRDADGAVRWLVLEFVDLSVAERDRPRLAAAGAGR